MQVFKAELSIEVCGKLYSQGNTSAAVHPPAPSPSVIANGYRNLISSGKYRNLQHHDTSPPKIGTVHGIPLPLKVEHLPYAIGVPRSEGSLPYTNGGMRIKIPYRYKTESMQHWNRHPAELRTPFQTKVFPKLLLNLLKNVLEVWNLGIGN